MKAFVAVAVFGLLAVAIAGPFTEDQMKKGQEHAAKCMAEHKVTPEIVQKIKSGDFSAVDDNVECFTLCFQQAAGFVDAQGNPNKDVIVQKLSTTKDKKEVEAVFEKCKDVQGSTPCKKAFNGFKCYRSAIVM